MEPTAADWARLGAAIKQARIDAGERVRSAFAAKLRISDSTLALIEGGRKKRGDGQPASDGMYALINGALGWPLDEWRRHVGLPVANPERDLVTLTTENRDRLVQLLRSVSQGINDVIKGLGG